MGLNVKDSFWNVCLIGIQKKMKFYFIFSICDVIIRIMCLGFSMCNFKEM